MPLPLSSPTAHDLKKWWWSTPIGHARRRQDGIPKLVDKFKINLARQFPTRQQQRILEVSLDRTRLEQMPVNEYLDLYVI